MAHVVQQISDLPGLYELVNNSKSSTSVTMTSSMRVAAVYACVNAIASDLAGLPVHVLRKTTKGVEKLSDHPVMDLVKLNPNPEMRAFDWYRTRRYHTLLSGNSYTFIESSRANPVKHLWPLDPGEVEVERVTTKTNPRGFIRYKVRDGISGPKYYKPESILHLKAFTWDGITGQSVITDYAKKQIGIGLELDEFEAAFFRNGLNPGGIFEHPGVLKDEKRRGFLKALKKRFGGSKNRGTPMILESGMKFIPYEVKMADQQFMDLLKLNKLDICSMFGVPQSRIGISDSNTNYNNSEQEKRRYYESGLLPWAIPDEQEMTFRLLTKEERRSGIYIKYNFNGFLRGDSKTRAEVSRIWSNMGVPVNELLEIDDRNPVEGGDVGLVQVNMAPIESIGDIQAAKAGGPAQARSSVFEPVIMDVMESIVSRENIALSRLLKKGADTDKIDQFYSDLSGFIARKLQPVSESCFELTGISLPIADFTRSYVERSKLALESGVTQELLSAWRDSKASDEFKVLNITIKSTINGAVDYE